MVPASCKGCGACCRYLSVEVVEGVDNVPNHMTEDVKDYGSDTVVMRMHSDGRCIALNADNTCSIYERRPVVCRRFERGLPKCENAILRVAALAADPTLDPASIP